MTDEYEESMGLKHIQIGKVEHDIFPIEGDNIKIARIMKSSKEKGIDYLYEQFNALYFHMVTRPPTEFEKECNSIRIPVPEEKWNRLKRFIEMNQVKLQSDMLIIFGWATKEQQEKFENMSEDKIKKLMDA